VRGTGKRAGGARYYQKGHRCGKKQGRKEGDVGLVMFTGIKYKAIPDVDAVKLDLCSTCQHITALQQLGKVVGRVKIRAHYFKVESHGSQYKRREMSNPSGSRLA